MTTTSANECDGGSQPYSSPLSRGRPTRIRKPAQKDPTIISWNDAFASIKSLDPGLHRGLLKDSRKFKFSDRVPLGKDEISESSEPEEDFCQKNLELPSSIPISQSASNQALVPDSSQGLSPVINPSYEISSEENLTSAVFKRTPLKPSKATMPTFKQKTYGKQSKARKSMLQDITHSEEIDELSLGPDDFVFLYSRPRMGAPVSLPSRLKCEPQDATKIPAYIPSHPRKRKLSASSSTGELDELAAEEPGTNFLQLGQARVKNKEGNDLSIHANELPFPQRKIAKVRKRRSKIFDIEKTEKPAASFSQQRVPSPESLQAKFQDQEVVTSKPQKVVTPVPEPVPDPADPIETQTPSEGKQPKGKRTEKSIHLDKPHTMTPVHKPQKASTPLLKLITPPSKQRVNKNLLKPKGKAQGVDIKTPGGTLRTFGMVNTPGGTVRRCGIDGFKCGRSFCFKCGFK